MSVLPPDLQSALEEWGKLKILGASPVSGGMINQAARVDTSDGPLFVKWNDSAPSYMLHEEAQGLAVIRSSKTVRVPAVIGYHDPRDIHHEPNQWSCHPPQYLVLEFVQRRPPQNECFFAEQFGLLLARMHREQRETWGFGNWSPNFIGRLRQVNEWRDTWIEFYRDCRIPPQMDIARKLGRLPIEREQLLVGVCDRLPDILKGLDSRPSLLHGDLWSGNYLTAGDEPVVFDPAVYYGEREMEIAFMQLFGGFPSRVFEAYNESYPLQLGYERRRALHQLYPLLVHLNHFGEPYGQDVDRVCRQYLD